MSEAVAHGYTFAELFGAIIGVLLTLSFGGWAGVVWRSAGKLEKQIEVVANDMAHRSENLVNEIRLLREEMHKDRLMNERRFIRLEHAAGVNHSDETV